MPRHGRASFSSSSSSVSSSSSSSSSSVLVSAQAPSNPSPGYGLLEPASGPLSSSPVSYSPTKHHAHLCGEPVRPRITPSLQARRHHRKSSSLASVGLPNVNVPAWSEVEAGIDTLRDKGLELGAGISELGGQICGRVPAVHGGVAFLSTLRSNLQLSSSLAPPSPYLHPVSPLPPKPTPSAYPTTITMPSPPASSPAETSTSTNLHTPDHAVAAADAETDPLADIPPLLYSPPDNEDDRIAALKLVADAVAQKRQTAASALIKSRLFLGLLVTLFGIAYQLLPNTADRVFRVFLTTGGIFMSGLVAVRFLVAGYLYQAEGINENWLDSDELIQAKFGDTVIGAAVLRVESSGGGRKAGKTGIIRAWTVRKRERGRGVGRGLMEALVEKAVREKGCGEVRFAVRRGDDGRAGEKQVLMPALERLTGVEQKMERREDASEKVLTEVLGELKGTGKGGKSKRRG